MKKKQQMNQQDQSSNTNTDINDDLVMALRAIAQTAGRCAFYSDGLCAHQPSLPSCQGMLVQCDFLERLLQRR